MGSGWHGKGPSRNDRADFPGPSNIGRERVSIWNSNNDPLVIADGVGTVIAPRAFILHVCQHAEKAGLRVGRTFLSARIVGSSAAT